MDYFYRSLKEDEDIVVFGRKHKATLVKPFIKVAIFVVIPIVLADYLLANKWLSIIFFGLLAIAFLIFIYEWVTWYFDSFLVTNRRVIQVHQKGLFSKEVRELTWDKLKDATFTVKGIVATLFNYGEIVLYSDSLKQPLILRAVSRPGEIRDLIVETKNAKSGAVT